MKPILLIAFLFLTFSAECQKKLKYNHVKQSALADSLQNNDSTPAFKNSKGKHRKNSNFESKIGRAHQDAWDSIPDPLGLVSDFEKDFTNEQIEHLDSIIIDFQKKTKIEIAIITVDSASVNGDYFGDLPGIVAKKWGIGNEKEMNGVVLAVSVSYRKTTFFLDVGIQQYMNDDDAKEIIKKKMIPIYKQGDNYGAVLAGLTSFIALINSRSVDFKGDH